MVGILAGTACAVAAADKRSAGDSPEVVVHLDFHRPGSPSLGSYCPFHPDLGLAAYQAQYCSFYTNACVEKDPLGLADNRLKRQNKKKVN